LRGEAKTKDPKDCKDPKDGKDPGTARTQGRQGPRDGKGSRVARRGLGKGNHKGCPYEGRERIGSIEVNVEI